jgi:hypothetical protein
VHSSLPNIPDPGTLIAEGLSSKTSPDEGWTRIEALNVHSQILSTVTSTRRSLNEIERTCKTSRGWWVVWMRLPPSQSASCPASGPAPHSARSSPLPSDADGDGDGAKTGSVAFNTDELREAFLIRRARDSEPLQVKSTGSRIASGMWNGMGMGGSTQAQRMGGKAAGWGPRGLAEGIGIDARRYVDDLLSLNR